MHSIRPADNLPGSAYFDELTPGQQQLLTDAEQAEDSIEFLRASAAPNGDKVVVAVLLGGPGDGAEFQQ